MVLVLRCIFVFDWNMAAETLRDNVLMGLRTLTVEQLLEISTGQRVTVAATKKTQKEPIFNAIVRFLTSETLEDAEDQGQGVFLKLKDEIDLMLAQNLQQE